MKGPGARRSSSPRGEARGEVFGKREDVGSVFVPAFLGGLDGGRGFHQDAFRKKDRRMNRDGKRRFVHVAFPFHLTEAAVKAALEHQERNPKTAGQGLRIWVGDKNCDGLIYGVGFDDPLPDDLRASFGALTVIVDPGTASLSEGSIVDYVRDERGSGFVVDNPRADRYKGKFFRKKAAETL